VCDVYGRWSDVSECSRSYSELSGDVIDDVIAGDVINAPTVDDDDDDDDADDERFRDAVYRSVIGQRRRVGRARSPLRRLLDRGAPAEASAGARRAESVVYRATVGPDTAAAPEEEALPGWPGAAPGCALCGGGRGGDAAAWTRRACNVDDRPDLIDISEISHRPVPPYCRHRSARCSCANTH